MHSAGRQALFKGLKTVMGAAQAWGEIGVHRRLSAANNSGFGEASVMAVHKIGAPDERR
jgi:hypothetical protein